MSKDRTAKYATEMDYDEFITWGAGYILFGIGEGRRLRDLVQTVVDHAVRNEVFGAEKGKNKT